MPTTDDLETQHFVQRYVLLIVGAVFSISLLIYFANFHGSLSPSHDIWGQFGDFLGGVVNPIVGFCTIWLLTVNLRQNQISLRQAHNELMLARQALEDSREMQEKTETALRRQIEIADETRDMANLAALSSHFYAKSVGLKKRADSEPRPHKPGGYTDLSPLHKAYYSVAHLGAKLDKILEAEAARLIERYPTDQE